MPECPWCENIFEPEGTLEFYYGLRDPLRRPLYFKSGLESGIALCIADYLSSNNCHLDSLGRWPAIQVSIRHRFLEGAVPLLAWADPMSDRYNQEAREDVTPEMAKADIKRALDSFWAPETVEFLMEGVEAVIKLNVAHREFIQYCRKTSARRVLTPDMSQPT